MKLGFLYLYEARFLEAAVIKTTSGRKCGAGNEGDGV